LISRSSQARFLFSVVVTCVVVSGVVVFDERAVAEGIQIFTDISCSFSLHSPVFIA